MKQVQHDWTCENSKHRAMDSSFLGVNITQKSKGSSH